MCWCSACCSVGSAFDLAAVLIISDQHAVADQCIVRQSAGQGPVSIVWVVMQLPAGVHMLSSHTTCGGLLQTRMLINN